MKDNYWNDKKLILATKKEKGEDLNYEIDMFRETCDQLNYSCQKTQFETNLLFESLPAHIRVLVDFFYKDIKNNPNDLIAQDFLLNTINWKNERPLKTELLNDAKNKADKQLAHLSLWRVKIKRDNLKEWDWNAIRVDIEKIIEKFESLK